MEEYEITTLENNITYAIVKEVNNYVYLVNPNDENDFCIRKTVYKDGNEYFETLDSEEEFQQAIKLLTDIK